MFLFHHCIDKHREDEYKDETWVTDAIGKEDSVAKVTAAFPRLFESLKPPKKTPQEIFAPLESSSSCYVDPLETPSSRRLARQIERSCWEQATLPAILADFTECHPLAILHYFEHYHPY